MSTPFNDPNDHRDSFSKLLDDRNFDEQGNFIKEEHPAEGDPGSAKPAPDATAQPGDGSTAQTAATQPPPDNTTKDGTPTSTAAETKTGTGETGGKPSGDGVTAATTKDDKATVEGEESEDTLKTKFSKPTDKGDEWMVRAYRETAKLTKRLAPVQSQLDRVGPEKATRALDFAAEIGDLDKPIADAAAKLEELAPSRAIELRNHFYTETLTHYPNEAATFLMGGEETTVDELKQGLALLRSGAKPGAQQPQSAAAATIELVKPEGVSDEDWENFQVDYEGIFKGFQNQLKTAAPATAAAPAAGADGKPEPGKDDNSVDARITKLTEELQHLRGEKERETTEQYVALVQDEGLQLENEIFSVVEDRLRELGLEPDTAKDDEATVTLKKSTADAIRKQLVAEFEGPNGPGGWDDFSLLSDEQKENRKLENQMMTLVARRDKSVRDYIPQMQARVDLTLDRIATEHMKRFNAAMIQPTEKPRNAGTTVQRPEIIGGTAASGVNTDKTPWNNADYKLPGEDSFGAMSRWLREHPGQPLPGRA